MTNSFEDLCRLFVSPASLSIAIVLLTSKSLFKKTLNSLTLLFEVVYVVLCNYEGAVLAPIILIEFNHLAAHHHYFKAGCKGRDYRK